MAMFGDFTKKGSFIENLPKIYGLYTGGFVVVIGWLSRTMQLDAYYVAGRQVPTVFNGMATAADWMSGASFVAMAGGIYMGGHPYLAFVVGWTGGGGQG